MDAKNMSREQFLQFVEAYITSDPKAAAYVQSSVAGGLQQARKELLHRCADMETALAVALARKYKGHDELILSVLMKHQNKLSLQWDDFIKRIADKENKV